jgi:hypothetical protein
MVEMVMSEKIYKTDEEIKKEFSKKNDIEKMIYATYKIMNNQNWFSGYLRQFDEKNITLKLNNSISFNNKK